MGYNQIFANNSNITLATVSLVSVYNTHVYGYYRNNLLFDPRDMHCLIISLKGSAQILLKDDTTVVLPENSLFFGHISTMQALISKCEHWHFACYWFIPHNITLPQTKACVLRSLNAEEENDASTRIIQLLQTKIASKIHTANSYFCSRLFPYLDEINPSEQKSTEIVERIITFIHTNVKKEIQVRDIAKEFRYCEKHIRFLFKSKLGLTPKQYIKKAKLENVYHLLNSSNLTVQEIADNYSFASVSHLINSFKAEYGLTPSAFREKQKTI
jgi:AraC-like DNA-binding protein